MRAATHLVKCCGLLAALAAPDVRAAAASGSSATRLHRLETADSLARCSAAHAAALAIGAVREEDAHGSDWYGYAAGLFTLGEYPEDSLEGYRREYARLLAPSAEPDTPERARTRRATIAARLRADLDGCDRLRQRVEPDVVGLVRSLCETGNPLACAALGQFHRLGEGVPKDPAMAALLLGTACDAGIALACGELGTLRRSAAPKDIAGAVRLYERACERGHIPSCTNLGMMRATGAEVPKDTPAAVTSLRRACQARNAIACDGLGVLLMLGDGAAKDTAGAVQAFAVACEQGRGRSCSNAGALLERSDGTVVQRACSRRPARRALPRRATTRNAWPPAPRPGSSSMADRGVAAAGWTAVRIVGCTPAASCASRGCDAR